MTEKGLVESVKNGIAVVVFERSAQCGKCKACAYFGDGMRAALPNDIDAKAGQRVMVAIPDGRVIGFSFITYIVPMTALLLGILLGAPVTKALGVDWNTDLTGAFTGIVLMVLSFVVFRLADRRVAKRGGALKLIGIDK